MKLCYSYRDFLAFFKIITAICRLVSRPWIFEMKTSFAGNQPKNRAKVYEFSSSQQTEAGTFFTTAIHVNTQLVTHCYVLNIYFKWECGNYFNLRFYTEKSEKLVKLTKECTLLKACTYNIVINLFECLKTLQITAACGIAVIFCVFRKAWVTWRPPLRSKHWKKSLSKNAITHRRPSRIWDLDRIKTSYKDVRFNYKEL